MQSLIFISIAAWLTTNATETWKNFRAKAFFKLHIQYKIIFTFFNLNELNFKKITLFLGSLCLAMGRGPETSLLPYVKKKMDA